MGLQVLQDLKDLKETQDPKDLPAHKVLKEPKVRNLIKG